MHIFIAFRGTEEVARSGVTDTPGGVAVPEMAAECFEEGGVEVDRIEVHNVHPQTEVIDPTPKNVFVFDTFARKWLISIPSAELSRDEAAKPPVKRGRPKKVQPLSPPTGCATCGNAGFYEDADGLHGCPQRCIYATKKLTSCLRAIDVFLKRISE